MRRLVLVLESAPLLGVVWMFVEGESEGYPLAFVGAIGFGAMWRASGRTLRSV